MQFMVMSSPLFCLLSKFGKPKCCRKYAPPVVPINKAMLRYEPCLIAQMLELPPEAILKKSKRAVGKEIGGATGPVFRTVFGYAPLLAILIQPATQTP